MDNQVLVLGIAKVFRAEKDFAFAASRRPWITGRAKRRAYSKTPVRIFFRDGAGIGTMPKARGGSDYPGRAEHVQSLTPGRSRLRRDDFRLPPMGLDRKGYGRGRSIDPCTKQSADSGAENLAHGASRIDNTLEAIT